LLRLRLRLGVVLDGGSKIEPPKPIRLGFVRELEARALQRMKHLPEEDP
jgi:hypothetical protein